MCVCVCVCVCLTCAHIHTQIQSCTQVFSQYMPIQSKKKQKNNVHMHGQARTHQGPSLSGGKFHTFKSERPHAGQRFS